MNGQTEYRLHFFFSRPCNTAEKPSSDSNTVQVQVERKKKRESGEITLKMTPKSGLLGSRKGRSTQEIMNVTKNGWLS